MATKNSNPSRRKYSDQFTRPRKSCAPPVDVFYMCYERCRYMTITITRHSSKKVTLKIGNSGCDVIFTGTACGTIYSNGYTYGYIALNKGYIIFKGNKDKSLPRFGYGIYKSDVEANRPVVSTFCTFPALDKESLIQTISEKLGQKPSTLKSKK